MQAGNRGTTTNSYGFYSISLPEGKYTLRFSYIGYAEMEIAVDLTADNRLNVALKADAKQLEEVVVSARSRNVNVSSPEMGVERISAATIEFNNLFHIILFYLSNIEIIPTNSVPVP